MLVNQTIRKRCCWMLMYEDKIPAADEYQWNIWLLFDPNCIWREWMNREVWGRGNSGTFGSLWNKRTCWSEPRNDSEFTETSCTGETDVSNETNNVSLHVWRGWYDTSASEVSAP